MQFKTQSGWIVTVDDTNDKITSIVNAGTGKSVKKSHMNALIKAQASPKWQNTFVPERGNIEESIIAWTYWWQSRYNVSPFDAPTAVSTFDCMRYLLLELNPRLYAQHGN